MNHGLRRQLNTVAAKWNHFTTRTSESTYMGHSSPTSLKPKILFDILVHQRLLLKDVPSPNSYEALVWRTKNQRLLLKNEMFAYHNQGQWDNNFHGSWSTSFRRVWGCIAILQRKSQCGENWEFRCQFEAILNAWHIGLCREILSTWTKVVLSDQRETYL